MAICPWCGGVLGRDCFNPQECGEITRDMAMTAHIERSNAEIERDRLWQLLDDISTTADVVKGDREAFYRIALEIVGRRGDRHEAGNRGKETSDGQ